MSTTSGVTGGGGVDKWGAKPAGTRKEDSKAKGSFGVGGHRVSTGGQAAKAQGSPPIGQTSVFKQGVIPTTATKASTWTSGTLKTTSTCDAEIDAMLNQKMIREDEAASLKYEIGKKLKKSTDESHLLTDIKDTINQAAKALASRMPDYTKMINKIENYWDQPANAQRVNASTSERVMPKLTREQNKPPAAPSRRETGESVRPTPIRPPSQNKPEMAFNLDTGAEEPVTDERGSPEPVNPNRLSKETDLDDLLAGIGDEQTGNMSTGIQAFATDQAAQKPELTAEEMDQVMGELDALHAELTQSATPPEPKISARSLLQKLEAGQVLNRLAKQKIQLEFTRNKILTDELPLSELMKKVKEACEKNKINFDAIENYIKENPVR